MIDSADAPRDFGIGNEFAVDLFTALRRELFGIVQLAVSKFFRKNDRSGDNWSRERAAPRFVDAGNSEDSCDAQFLFVTKSAAPVHPRKSLPDFREVTSDM